MVPDSTGILHQQAAATAIGCTEVAALIGDAELVGRFRVLTVVGHTDFLAV